MFSVERLPTYVLVPRDPADVELLVESLRHQPGAFDMAVVIGTRGPIAPSEMCNGLTIPVLALDHVYSFDREELLGSIPVPAELAGDESRQEQFQESAGELLDRIMQMADNAGATDEHRALNYLAVRYPAVYALAAEANHQEKSLTAVEVRPSRLSGVQTIVDVVFAYTHRRTDVAESYFVRVDVSGEFPFLVTKLQPFFER